MPNRGAGPRAQRRAQMLERLLPAAEPALGDGVSFADLSLDAVLSQAGVAKSTFYRHFTGKPDLLRSWFEHLTGETGPDLPGLSISGPASLEDVERAVRARFAPYRPHLPVMAAAFEAAYYDPDLRKAVDERIERANTSLVAHLREGQQRGWIDPGLPPRETAVWLNWMAVRGASQLLRTGDEDRIETLITAFARLVWSVLYAFAGDRQASTER